MLVTLDKVLKKAFRGKYAVGAFNTSDLEITQAIIEAAVELKAPVIIQTSEKAIKFAGLEELAGLIKTEARKVKVPVVLHLDHGRDMDLVKDCIGLGYTSIMYDGSHLSFAKNVANTKKVVKLAHAKKISVEGELGPIAGTEDDVKARKNFSADPDQAAAFVEKTGIDALAPSIGLAHGLALPKEKIELKRLRVIAGKVKIPLVLHGASEGVTDKEIKQAIKFGVCKVNIDTAIRLAFAGSLRKFLKEEKGANDPRAIMSEVKEAIKKVIKEKIKLFGSAGKA